MKSNSELILKNTIFDSVSTCDECDKELVPREDLLFRDEKIGITLCLDCRDRYLARETQ